ncbi:MAG: methyltransferase [Bacteroidetes bacterium]|nr:methyltransferase [Bacteroidota bacterium]
MFRKISKKAQELAIKPLILWYLKKERRFVFKDLKMIVFPGVFHPLLFHSTLILVNEIKKMDLRNKTFLEPGCGSGLVSLMAAKSGAHVTSLDINRLAIENTVQNAKFNKLDLKIILSDLFENLPIQKFDYIFINPPYYPVNPKNESEMAWFCGQNFEYFTKLFQQLTNYYDSNSKVVMILSEDCNIPRIKAIAKEHDQKLELLETKHSILEKNFLFQIIQAAD